MMTNFSMGSFVAGAMFGLLIAGAWSLNNNLPLLPFSSSSLLATSTVSAIPASEAISVTDQPAGDTVVVASITAPSSGIWVAVREIRGNDLGNVLGAARTIGLHSNFQVSLLRATKPGRSYAVELYRDDAGGVFDPAMNSVYIDFDTGARVVAYFKTTE